MNTTENSTATPSINEDTNNTNTSNQTRSEGAKTVSVNVNTEKTSIGIFLLCFFLPFLSPIIAIIRGKFLFVIGILLLWGLCALLIFIPILGAIIVVIIDIVISLKVTKMTKKTEAVVNV